MNNVVSLEEYRYRKEHADEIAMDKQYDEFVSLLRYFVFLQDKKVNCVSIDVENNEYIISENDKIICRISCESDDCNDKLVSALMDISPLKINASMAGEAQKIIRDIWQGNCM